MFITNQIGKSILRNLIKGFKKKEKFERVSSNLPCMEKQMRVEISLSSNGFFPKEYTETEPHSEKEKEFDFAFLLLEPVSGRYDTRLRLPFLQLRP